MNKLGELKLNNNIINDYYIKHINENIFYFEKVSNKEIKDEDELYQDILKNIKKILKKQPEIFKFLSKILILQGDISDDRTDYIHSFLKSNTLDKLTNRDILRNLKNYGLKWNDIIEKIMSNKLKLIEIKKNKSLSDFTSYCRDNDILGSIELLDDKIESILLEQKAKRLIQKIYSNSYSHLKNEKTLKIFKLFVEKNIPLSQIQSDFGKKLARYKDADDANFFLSEYLNKLTGWTKSLYLKTMEEMNIKVVNETENELLVKINSYEQMKKIGSGQWCIVYDKEFYMDYRKPNNNIFIKFDFSKQIEDKYSMLGVVLSIDGKLIDGYWRNDQQLNINDMEVDNVYNSIDKIPINELKNIENTISDIAKDIEDKDDRDKYILEKMLYCEPEKIHVIFKKMLEEKMLTDNIDEIKYNLLTKIYQRINDLKYVKENKDFLTEEIVLNIRNYMKRSKKIINRSKTNNESSYCLLNEMMYRKDFETMKIFASKVEYSRFFKLLDVNYINLSNKENQNSVFEILKIYKEKKNDIPFRCNLIKFCYFIKEKYKEEDGIDDFIIKIFNINENKYPLRETLMVLNGEKVNNYSENKNIDLNILKHVVLMSLKNINKEKLESDMRSFNLEERFLNVDKDIIKKIKEKLKITKKSNYNLK